MDGSNHAPAGWGSVRPPKWVHVLVTGLVLWILSVLVTGLTGNLNMVPTVVLLGSFLVPVTGVVWYLDHYQTETLTPGLVINALVVGGVLGVLAASLLEAWLLSDGALTYLGVGLVEELAKLAGLVFVARGLRRYTTREGIVLGAAVGFGFAALESSGYAFNALIVQQGNTIYLSLVSLVFTELLRSVLAPVGHGLWTAILGGVLFSASRPAGHLRFTWKVLGAYLLVSLLHSLWDSMRGIAVVVTELLTGTAGRIIMTAAGPIVRPTEGQIVMFSVVQYAGLAIVSIVGLLVLWLLWRAARHESAEEQPEEESSERAA